MISRSPKCYIPSFFNIGPPVPKRRFLKGFYHIWAWRPSLSCDQHYVNKFKANIQHLVKKGPMITEKSKFQLELFFYEKRCLPLLGINNIKTSLNKITNRNSAHFSSKQSSSYPHTVQPTASTTDYCFDNRSG